MGRAQRAKIIYWLAEAELLRSQAELATADWLSNCWKVRKVVQGTDHLQGSSLDVTTDICERAAMWHGTWLGFWCPSGARRPAVSSSRGHNSELKGKTDISGGVVVLECAHMCLARLGFLWWPKARPLFHLLDERACTGSWEKAAGRPSNSSGQYG
jgi:hypothetical protein